MTDFVFADSPAPPADNGGFVFVPPTPATSRGDPRADPELEDEISRIQNTTKGNSRPKATQWNNYGTRTPLEVLQAEREDQIQNNPHNGVPPTPEQVAAYDATPLAATKSQPSNFVFVPQPESQPDFVFADTTPRPPAKTGTMSYVANSLYEGTRQAIKSVAQVASGIQSIVPGLDQLPDANAAAASINNNKSYVTPEEEAGASGVDKFLGGMASGVPAMVGAMGVGALAATAPISGPAAGLIGAAAFGLHAGLSSSRSDLEQGVDMTTTAEKAAAQTILGTAVGLVPGVGSTYLKSAVLGAGSNLVSGIAGDIVDKALYEAHGYDKQAAAIDPFSVETNLGRVGAGVTFGFGFKAFQRYRMSPEERNVELELNRLEGSKNEQDQVMIEQLKRTQVMLRGLGKDYVAPDAGKTYMELEDQLHGEKKPVSAQEFLSAIASDPEAPATRTERVLAAAMLRISDAVGLDTTQVHSATREDLTRVIDNPDGTQTTRVSKGRYDPATDTAYVRDWGNVPNSQAPVSTYLHELFHSITYAAVHNYMLLTGWSPDSKPGFDLNSIMGKTEGKWQQLDENAKVMMERVDKLRQNYELAREQTNDKWRKDSENNVPYSPEQVKERDRIKYGFSDLHEYTTHVMTNEIFQRHLNTLRVTDAKQMDSIPFKVQNRFQEFKSAMLHMMFGSDLVSKPEATMLATAQDHMFRVMDAMNAKTRMGVITHERKSDFTGWNEYGGPRYGINEGVAHDNARTVRSLEAKRQIVEAGQWNEFHGISRLLQTSASLAEFTNRMNMRSASPVWREFVKNNAEHIYKNADHVIDAVGSSQDFEKLTPSVQALLGDPRSPDEFFKALKDRLAAQGDKRLTIPDDADRGGTWLWGPDQLRMIKGPDTLGGTVMSFYLSKAQEYRSLKAQYYTEFRNFLKAAENLNRTEKQNLAIAVAYFDHGDGQKVLHLAKIQWPTVDMLRQAGLKDNEIKAYQDRAKAMDFVMDGMDQERLHEGLPPVPRKPGYMQHSWVKTFKVLVDAHIKDPGAGTETARTVEVHDFRFRWTAQKFIDNMNNGKYDIPASVGPDGTKIEGTKFRANVDPKTKSGIRVPGENSISKSEDFLNVLTQSLRSYENKSQMSGDVIQALEKISNDSTLGLNKHLIDRTDVKGFLGDMRPLITGEAQHPISTGKWATWGFDTTTNKVLELDKNYGRSMSEYLGNAAFTREVIKPMLNHAHDPNTQAPLDPFDHTSRWGEFLENTPQLREYMRDFAHNFTGQTLNYLNFLDRELTYEPTVLFGLSPKLAGDALTMLRNVFSYAKLRLNPGFYIGNTVQSAYTMGMLELANAMARNGGRTMKTPWATVGSFWRDRGDPIKSAEMRLAVNWARDNHVLESYFEQQLRLNSQPNSRAETASGFIDKITGRDVNPAIEDKSRTWSFQLAFKHFRENGFNVEDSRTAAAQIMRQTNTDYMRESRPLMFQQLGLIGKGMSPFQVYRSAQLGNLYMAVKVLKDSGFKAWQPIVTTMMTYFVMAGVTGIPLAAEYDKLAEFWNEHMPEQHMPSLFEMMKKAHAPDWMMWGAISDATKAVPGLDNGINLSGSLGSVPIEQGIPQAMLPFVDGIKEIAGLILLAGGNALGMSRPVNRADIHAAASTVTPGFMQPWLQKWLQLDNSKVYPTAQGMTGEYERTPADERANLIGNRMSITEASERKITQIVEVRLKNRQDTVKQYLQSYVDFTRGKGIQSNPNEILRYLLSPDGGGMSEDQVLEQSTKMAEKELTTGRRRDADLSDFTGAWKQQIRQDLESK